VKPTRIIDLIAFAAFAALLSRILVERFYGDIPPSPWYAGASLLPVALLEAIAACYVRARIARSEVGPGPGRIHPITVANLAALAKASSPVGAVFAGLWAGLAWYALPLRGQLAAAAADTPGALTGFGCAAALVAAALWLEHCCRAPIDPDDAPTNAAA